MENGIFCVESLWDNRTDSRRPSVSPLLEYVSRARQAKFTRFDCGTVEELTLRLQNSRKPGYGILYISYHGSNGLIQMENADLTLYQLAEIMGERFKGWMIHFWCCSTLDIPKVKVKEFKKLTKAKRVSGYRKVLYWGDVYDTAPLELAWLACMIEGKRELPDEYRTLGKKNGMVIV